MTKENSGKLPTPLTMRDIANLVEYNTKIINADPTSEAAQKAEAFLKRLEAQRDTLFAEEVAYKQAKATEKKAKEAEVETETEK